MADTTVDSTIIGEIRKAKRGRSSRPRRENFGGERLPRGTVHVLRYDGFDGRRESFVAFPGDDRRDA